MRSTRLASFVAALSFLFVRAFFYIKANIDQGLHPLVGTVSFRDAAVTHSIDHDDDDDDGVWNGALKHNSSSVCTAVPDHVPHYEFHPLRFFDDQDGPGREFRPQLHNIWYNFSATLRPRFLLFDSGGADPDCQFVFFHIHKNGGTTVDKHNPFPVDRYYMNRELALGSKNFESRSKTHMENVCRNQTSAPASISVFTFLRDPVDRFLSSLSQVLRRRTVVDLSPCHRKGTTEELIDCVLTGMENSQDDNVRADTKNVTDEPKFFATFPEMHLMPQAFELYRQIYGMDIAVDVMDLSHVGASLQRLGANDTLGRERSVTGTVLTRFPQFQLTRDGLTLAQIRRICELYRVDVILLQTVGVTTTVCSTLE